MRYLLPLILLFTSLTSSADDFIDLNEVSLNYGVYNGARTYPISLLPGHELTNTLDVNINMAILKYGYFTNRIHSAMDSADGGPSQFRVVGWEYRLGVHVSPYLDIGMYHYSEHILDTEYPLPSGYPQATAVELKIYLYKKNKADSLIP